MAIVSFGQTYRGAYQGFALQNTSSSNVQVPLLGLNIKSYATENVSLDVFDEYIRNMRHPQVYDVNTKGQPYKDDVYTLTQLISGGTLVVHTSTYTASSNTWTIGASAAPTVAGTSLFWA